MHQLLVHGQADPEDMNLTRRDDANKRSEEVRVLLAPVEQILRPHLLLHQVLQLRDLLRVVRVAGDVILIEERLATEKNTC